jgi:hypothetical protein
MSKVILPEVAFRRAVVVVGTPGTGKSYNTCGALVIPALEAGSQVVVIDPTDAWWGLALRPDGKKASGYDIAVFGGDHGDMELTPNMGRAMGELLGRERINAVLSLVNMELSEQVHFVSEFSNAIMRHNRKPIHLVIDEADEFCPQQPSEKGELMKCKGRVKRIVTRGRKPGFRPVMITQRPQALDTGARNLCQVMIALQCSGTHERESLKDYVKANGDLAAMTEMLGSISSLEVGGAWIWAPRDKILERVRFPAIPVYDSFKEEEDNATAFKGTVPITPARLEGLKAALAEFEAERKANDPEALRARIRDLEREKATPKPKPAATDGELQREYDLGATAGRAEVEKAYQPYLKDLRRYAELEGQVVGFGVGYVHGWKECLHRCLNAVGAQAELLPAPELRTGRPPMPGEPPVRPTFGAAAAALPERPSEAPVGRVPAQRVADRFYREAPAVKPSGNVETRILKGLLWWHNLGFVEVSRAQLAVAAGYAISTKSFHSGIGNLVAASRVSLPQPGQVKLLDASGIEPPDYSGDQPLALIDKVIDDEAEHRVLHAIVAFWPKSVTRAELAPKCGYALSTKKFHSIIGKLTTLDMISQPKPGEVKLRDWVVGEKDD